MHDVVVKRSEWLHGEGTFGSVLLRAQDNKMCCLGFVCVQAFNALPVDILGIETPALAPDKIQRVWPDKEYIVDRQNEDTATFEMMQVNDREFIDDSVREEQLAELATHIGINLTFID
jgi:hypothetical protein